MIVKVKFGLLQGFANTLTMAPIKPMPTFKMVGSNTTEVISVFEALYRSGSSHKYARPDYGQAEWRAAKQSVRNYITSVAEAFVKRENDFAGVLLRSQRLQREAEQERQEYPTLSTSMTDDNDDSDGSDVDPDIDVEAPIDGAPDEVMEEVMDYTMNPVIDNTIDVAQTSFVTLLLPPILQDVSSDVGAAGGLLEERYIPARFTEVTNVRKVEDMRRRLKFSEMWRDFVISNNIPRLVGQRFINQLKLEDPEWNIHEMPYSWVTLAKITPKEMKGVGTIETRLGRNSKKSEKFLDFGLYNMLVKHLDKFVNAAFPNGGKPTIPHVNLEFSTDGAPLCGSGRDNDLWPVCVTPLSVGPTSAYDDETQHRRIPTCNRKIITIGYHLGPGKPSHPEKLLRAMVNELKTLDPRPRQGRTPEIDAENDGEQKRSVLTVSLQRGAADMPATSFAKGTYGVMSTFGCDKCEEPGRKFKGTGMSIYATTNLKLREDCKFMDYDNHVKKDAVDPVTKQKVQILPSPLVELGYFGMVSGFIIDSMHTVYLRIGQHLVTILKQGTRKVIAVDKVVRNQYGIAIQRTSIRVRKYNVLNSRIEVCAHFLPWEFQRYCSSLEFVGDWKYVEHRLFILYIAFAVYEDIGDEQQLSLLKNLQVFLYLVGGCDPSPVPEDILQFAQKIAEYFVTLFMHVRAGKGVPPSVHMMLHIVQECRHNKCHYECLSTSPYENLMRSVKPRVTAGYGKLAQLKRRYMEVENYAFNRSEDGRILRDAKGEPSVGWSNAPPKSSVYQPQLVLGRDGLQEIKLRDFKLTNRFKDSFCLVANNGQSDRTRHPAIVQIKTFVEDICSGEIHICGYKWRTLEHCYTTPAPSMIFHKYVFSDRNNQPSSWPITSVVGKLMVLPKFSEFGLCEISLKDLGDDYCLVKKWIGTAERHAGHEDPSTLY